MFGALFSILLLLGRGGHPRMALWFDHPRGGRHLNLAVLREDEQPTDTRRSRTHPARVSGLIARRFTPYTTIIRK